MIQIPWFKGPKDNMSHFHPDNVGYYGKPMSSLSKDELLEAVLELIEIIHNCPVKGKCNDILELIEKEKN
jgi:hypothetical protein